MKAVPTDRIFTECMDCGQRSMQPRGATAPDSAMLLVTQCGCKAQAAGAPYYVDGDGELIDERIPGTAESP